MLAHQSYGKGRPVVLIHAFPLSSQMWERGARDLAKTRRVILPDLPGFGKSPRQSKPSIPRMAQEVAELLDRLKIEEPVFMGGLSMGGYVTFEFLRQFPEKVQALGLFSTRAAADTPEVRERRIQNIQKIQSEGLPAFVDKAVANLLGKTTLQSKPLVVREVKEMILANAPEGITDALLAMAERRDSTDLLSSIRYPTLVVAAEEDSFVPVEEAELFAKKIPSAEFHMMKRVGHLTNLEDPSGFQSLLERFLKTSMI